MSQTVLQICVKDIETMVQLLRCKGRKIYFFKCHIKEKNTLPVVHIMLDRVHPNENEWWNGHKATRI